MILLSYLAANLLLVFACGLGITYWISPTRQESDLMPFAAHLGLAMITLIGWYLFQLTPVAGTDAYASTLAAVLVATSVSPIALPKHRQLYLSRLRKTLLSFQTLVALGVAGVATVGMAYPAFQHRELTPISIGNNDSPAYATIERYLKEFSRDCTTGFVCSNEKIRYQAEDEVFGAFQQSAFFSSLWGLQTYQIQTVALLTYIFLLTFGVFYLARTFFGFELFPAAIIAFLSGLNPILFYSVYQGFKSQLLAMNWTIALFAAVFPAYKYANKKWAEGLPSTVLLAWAISATYPHMLPPVYALLSFVGLLGLVHYEPALRKTSIRSGLFFGIAVVALVSLLSPHRAYVPIRAILFLNNAVAAWFVPWMSLDRIFGCTLPTSYFTLIPRNRIALLRSLPFLFWALLGFRTAYHAYKTSFFRSLAIIVFVGAGYCVLAYSGQEGGQLGGYKSYKWLAFFLPLTLPSLHIAFKSWRVFPKIAAVAGAFIVVASMASTALLLHAAAQAHEWVPPELAAVHAFESSPSISAINILESDWWNQMWLVALLSRKPLNLASRSYYPASLKLNAPWDLQGSEENIGAIEGQSSKTDELHTSSYRLAVHGFTVQFGAGWHDRENGHIWSSDQISEISINAPSKQTSRIRRVLFDYTLLDPKNRLTVLVNDKPFEHCEAATHCELDSVPIHEGRILLRIVASLPARPPNLVDHRNLGFMLKTLKILP